MLQATTADAYRLFHQGSLTFAKIEHNGIRIDMGYLDNTLATVGQKIKAMEEELRQDDVYKVWKKRFGDQANVGSRPQLAVVLYQELQYPCKHRTNPSKKFPDGQPKVDDEALEDVNLPFIKSLLRVEKYKKLQSTYLVNIKREVVDGFIHPFFHLHTVITFRSSSSEINFQNQPVRDPEIGPIIRRCFIPRKGRNLIEIDFGALEFRIAAIIWCDPNMIEYARDESKDIHRDTAADIFCCRTDQVNKQTRYVGKNQVVFPLLYGSYYVQCARHIWDEMDKLKLVVEDLPVKQWLAQKGIKELGACDPKKKPIKGTFEYHIKQVEDAFMKRFPVFAAGKETLWRQYQETGEFSMLSGFVCRGVYSKNFLLNARIQGFGFHCLLESLNQQQNLLERKRMESLLVGQIHDSSLGDVPDNEVQDYLHSMTRIMTQELPKKWPAIIVPLKAEVDLVSPGETWHDKKPWEDKDGVWGPKQKG